MWVFKNRRKYNLLVVSLIMCSIFGLIFLVIFTPESGDAKYSDIFGKWFDNSYIKIWGIFNDNFGFVYPILLGSIVGACIVELVLKTICVRNDTKKFYSWIKRNHKVIAWIYHGIFIAFWFIFMGIWQMDTLTADYGFGKMNDFIYLTGWKIQVATKIVACLIGASIYIYIAVKFRVKLWKTDFWLHSRMFEVLYFLIIFFILSFVLMYMVKKSWGRPHFFNYALTNNEYGEPMLKLGIYKYHVLPTFIDEARWNNFSTQDQDLIIKWIQGGVDNYANKTKEEIVVDLFKNYNSHAWGFSENKFIPWYEPNNLKNHLIDFWTQNNRTDPDFDGYNMTMFPSGHTKAYLCGVVCCTLFTSKNQTKSKGTKTKQWLLYFISIFMLLFCIGGLLTTYGHWPSDIAFTLMVDPLYFYICALIASKSMMPIVNIFYKGFEENSQTSKGMVQVNSKNNNVYIIQKWYEYDVVLQKVKQTKWTDQKKEKIRKYYHLSEIE